MDTKQITPSIAHNWMHYLQTAYTLIQQKNYEAGKCEAKKVITFLFDYPSMLVASQSISEFDNNQYQVGVKQANYLIALCCYQQHQYTQALQALSRAIDVTFPRIASHRLQQAKYHNLKAMCYQAMQYTKPITRCDLLNETIQAYQTAFFLNPAGHFQAGLWACLLLLNNASPEMAGATKQIQGLYTKLKETAKLHNQTKSLAQRYIALEIKRVWRQDLKIDHAKLLTQFEKLSDEASDKSDLLSSKAIDSAKRSYRKLLSR